MKPPDGRPLDYGKNRNVVEVGQVISGKYKLLRLLGDGGMGSVYEAEHLTLGTHVAIKVLHVDLARRPGIAERFLQEARVSAQIRSPHVVQVMDVDRTPDGVAYLVMELLQGEPLSGVVKREHRLDLKVACEYTTQILQALEAAHALGVIHRDLKPDNVFVTFQGGKPVLKLIDFGIAKLKTAQAGQTKNLTVAGMLMGTPEYMAPEQAYSADKVDVRADLYAVGVMLYEMLSGQVPANADDPRVLVLKVERGEMTPLVQAAPGIRPEVAGFVHRAMAPRPELRFASATEMRIALDDVVNGKRPAGTAKIAAQPAGFSHADTADARPELGTGTVMGAPVDAALTPPGMGSGPPPPGGTVGAPPMTYHPHQAPVPPMVAQPSYEPSRTPSRKSGGSGLIIALAVIALLLGAGAVVVWGHGHAAADAGTTAPDDRDGNTDDADDACHRDDGSRHARHAAHDVDGPASTAKPQSESDPRPKDAGAPAHADAGPSPAPEDAGSGQTTIVTSAGSSRRRRRSSSSSMRSVSGAPSPSACSRAWRASRSCAPSAARRRVTSAGPCATGALVTARCSTGRWRRLARRSSSCPGSRRTPSVSRSRRRRSGHGSRGATEGSDPYAAGPA